MHALILGLVTVAAASAAVPTVGYHEAVGIPLAARIKAQEDQLLAGVDGNLPDPRIVGGVVAPTNAHPHLAGLVISFLNINGVAACGSSLLTNNRLVTAAHCWWDGTLQGSQFEVVLGSHWLFSGGTRIVTNQVVMHPSWSPWTLVSDIAVIYLPWSVAFSNSIQPVALPLSTQINDQFVGEWAVAAGYGMTSDLQTGISTSAVISQVQLQVISLAQCQATFGQWATASNICTSGAGGVGICGGDSGGPLVVNRNGQNYLVGISSFIAWDGCQAGLPSAYARVTSFYSFIIGHL